VLLNETLFRSLPLVRGALESWRHDYNTDDPPPASLADPGRLRRHLQCLVTQRTLAGGKENAALPRPISMKKEKQGQLMLMDALGAPAKQRLYGRATPRAQIKHYRSGCRAGDRNTRR
jgi:hypothetical protein